MSMSHAPGGCGTSQMAHVPSMKASSACLRAKETSKSRRTQWFCLPKSTEEAKSGAIAKRDDLRPQRRRFRWPKTI